MWNENRSVTRYLEVVKESDDESGVGREEDVLLAHCMLHLFRFDDSVFANHLERPDLLVCFIHHKKHLTK